MRHTLTFPDTFGASLRFLRKRAQLTQDELGRAVGYSREQIARLENGSRLPDLAVVAALFVPALLPERDRALTEQFLALAGRTRRAVQLTVTRTQETRIELVETTAVATLPPRYAPPAPLLPLLGRQADVAELLARLRTARLITLIGAPGIGKTRLALEVGNAARTAFADGVAFVSLAEAQTAADIPYAALQALALTPAAGQLPADALRDALRPRQPARRSSPTGWPTPPTCGCCAPVVSRSTSTASTNGRWPRWLCPIWPSRPTWRTGDNCRRCNCWRRGPQPLTRPSP